MNTIYILLIYLGLFQQYISDQNLIPNGDFEQTVGGIGHGHPKYWTKLSPKKNNSTPVTTETYVDFSYTYTCYDNVKENKQYYVGYTDTNCFDTTICNKRYIFSNQNFKEPFSGNRYIKGAPVIQPVIYQVKLTKLLRKGKTYLLEFYAQVDEYDNSGKFEISFSPDSIAEINDILPKSEYLLKIDFKNKNLPRKWTKFTYTFKPEGDCLFMQIGHLQDYSASLKTEFMLDDIALYSLDDYFHEADKGVPIRGLNFKYNSFEITSDSYTSLDFLSAYLKDTTAIKLEIAGHTDNVGNAAANQSLSQNRAESVRKYLTSRGISPDRLTAKGYGDTQPAAPNDTPAGRAQNRRVEVKIIK